MSNALVRKLRREVAVNPVKAAVLGVVVLIALWFWAPLVARWYSSNGPSDETAAAATSEPNSAARSPVVVANLQSSSKPNPVKSDRAAEASSNWRSVVQAAAADPRTRPNRRIAHLRDPFGLSASELAAVQARKQKKANVAVVPELNPTEAGLVLNSTLIGSGKPIALISGEPYSEGDMVRAKGDSTFTVVEILARQIVLARRGKQYTLAIQPNPRVSSDARGVGEGRAASADSARRDEPLPFRATRAGRAAAVSNRSKTSAPESADSQ